MSPQYDRLSSLYHTVNRTLSMDAVRRCPRSRLDPAHYLPDGSCLCTQENAAIPEDGAMGRHDVRSRTIISTVQRPTR